jgi:hypothetical protein
MVDHLFFVGIHRQIVFTLLNKFVQVFCAVLAMFGNAF